MSPYATASNQGDAAPAAWRVQWDCQLSGLRDLNQSVPAVRAESLHWLQWYQAQFGFQGLRIDAMGHVPAVRSGPTSPVAAAARALQLKGLVCSPRSARLAGAC